MPISLIHGLENEMSDNELKGIAIIAVAIPFLIGTIFLIIDSFKHGGGGFANAGKLNPNRKNN